MAAQSFQPDLQSLQQAIDQNDDDASSLMPFIRGLDKFASDDQITAKTLLQTVFWSEKSNSYNFTTKFKLLTAENLSIIIKQLGDKKIEKFIFVEKAKPILEHYPPHDLVSLLGAHYYDRFANFVFLQFKPDFLSAKLSLRVRYFKTISVKAIVIILKEGNVGKSLTLDELIVISIKMKKYLIENQQSFDIHDNTWLDSQSILPEIINLIMAKDNIKVLTTENLQTIIDNDLIVNIEQSKDIINQLLLRQKKLMLSNTSNIGGSIDIKNKINTDKLIGIMSTDNFAIFQKAISNKMNQYQTLHGPLVIMPQTQNNNNNTDNNIHYSCLVQIQNLNPLFNQNKNNQQQPKGSIFIILLQQLPQNFEVIFSVSQSNVFAVNALSQSKDLNIGINNRNPIAVIPWPLPSGIGKAVSFQIHCTLRPSQQQIQNIRYGIGNLLNSNQEQKSNDNLNNNLNNDNVNTGLWNIGGGKMVMMIYSGSNNQQRLSWINVFVQDNKMTFYDCIDSACAQLALPTPTKPNQQQQQQQQQSQPQTTTNLFGGGGFGLNLNQSQNTKTQHYIIRNQMGHQLAMDQNVIKYLDKMVMNSNLFPVFIFTKSDKQPRQQQQQQQRQDRRGTGFGQFNFGATGNQQQTQFPWR